ncbi:MAG: hypothetical protein DMF56_11760 [Acidobacteria bacterium]|nr:MAG: hypothetical protein DMF56_11760 [Acidobacteriota bacterium]
MRRIVFLFLVLAAAASYADVFRIEPVAPTSASGVFVRVDTLWNGCLPRDAKVTRNGQDVDVLWTVPRGGGCVTAFIPWSDRVSLGALPPGTYKVTLRVDSPTGLQTIGTKTITVAEGASAFQLNPAFVSTTGGMVELIARVLCVANGSDVKKVVVDGAEVRINVDPCSVIAFLPPHAAGPVDVSVQVNDATYTVKSTLRYLDRSATPDEATFERVLIPVLYFGPGAFGSQWQTDATLRNLASTQLQWFSSVAFPTLCDVGDCGVPSGGTFGLFEFGNRPKGLVLFVPRTISDDVHYGLIARDTSRDDGAWGAEVRVVREKDARYGKFVIENVPLDSRYRTTLRIYAIDGGASEVKMSAFVGDVGSVATVRIEGCDAPPCNSADPGFGTFDVRSLFPRLPDKSRITLYIEAPSLRPHWALVSVTNNTTQHVTVISPQ